MLSRLIGLPPGRGCLGCNSLAAASSSAHTRQRYSYALFKRNRRHSLFDQLRDLVADLVGLASGVLTFFPGRRHVGQVSQRVVQTLQLLLQHLVDLISLIALEVGMKSVHQLHCLWHEAAGTFDVTAHGIQRAINALAWIVQDQGR